MSADGLTWFKSTYSGPEGDSCLEVAVSWRTSSYSGTDGDNCVEVAACTETVHVRDSKDTSGPQLTLPPTAWGAFVAHVATDAHAATAGR